MDYKKYIIIAGASLLLAPVLAFFGYSMFFCFKVLFWHAGVTEKLLSIIALSSIFVALRTYDKSTR